MARPDGFVFNYKKEHPEDPGPILSPEGEPLKENQCVCGTINCTTEYACYTSGF
jgi:hypothetical protein